MKKGIVRPGGLFRACGAANAAGLRPYNVLPGRQEGGW